MITETEKYDYNPKLEGDGYENEREIDASAISILSNKRIEIDLNFDGTRKAAILFPSNINEKEKKMLKDYINFLM